MYSIQNLTNSAIKFQGITISAYGTATVNIITDYISLSRLSNSGKIRYCTVKAPKIQESAKVHETVTEVEVKPVIAETKPELVVEQKEEVKEETVVEIPVEEEKTTALFETTFNDETSFTSTKKKGRSRK